MIQSEASRLICRGSYGQANHVEYYSSSSLLVLLAD